MSSTTTNLNLFKYDTATDGKEVFSINTALNDNWDKIDTSVGELDSVLTSLRSSLATVATSGSYNDLKNKPNIADTAFPAKSIASSGYVKLASGLIIQWGHYTTTDTTGTNTWPIAFSSTVYSCVVGSNTNSGNPYNYNSMPHSWTKTGYSRNKTSGSYTQCYVVVGK